MYEGARPLTTQQPAFARCYCLTDGIYDKNLFPSETMGIFSALFMKNSKGVLIDDKKKFIGAIEIRGYNLYFPERFKNLQKVL